MYLERVRKMDKKRLISAAVAGLVIAGVTASVGANNAFANHKKGHKKNAKGKENSCKGKENSCKGKENSCKGKEGAAGEEHKE